MIAGKGHEQGQEFKDGRKLPFDDLAVARDALRTLADRNRTTKPGD
jgi:UDP-N-acetylmuramyl tripeptide synthase